MYPCADVHQQLENTKFEVKTGSCSIYHAGIYKNIKNLSIWFCFFMERFSFAVHKKSIEHEVGNGHGRLEVPMEARTNLHLEENLHA